MSTIKTQAELDAIQGTTDATYIDAGNTVIEAVAGTTITVERGHILVTSGLQSTTASNFTVDNAILNINKASNGSSESWSRGKFSSVGATLISTHGSGNHQWPGFAVADQSDRPTYDLTNATILSRNPTTSTLTNHFGNMALTGNSFDGLTILNGGFFYPLGAVALLRVAFSPDSAADASTPTGVDTYVRSQKATGGGNPGLTATYSGFFECDLTGMTSTTDNILSFNIRPDDYAPTSTQIAVETNKAVAWFLIENDYSAETLSVGLTFVSGNGGNDDDQSFQSVTGYLIAGIPWAPEWRDDGVFTAVTDVVTNLGDRTVWIASSDGDNTANIPTSIDATSGSNYIGNYVGDTKRTGYLLETATAISRSLITDSQQGQQTIAVQAKGTTIASLPWWSYTHQCYTAGAVRTRTTTAPTLIGEFQYDQTILDVIDIASEGALLNNKTLEEATALIDSDSLSTLDDLYSVMKSLAYVDRDTTVQFSVEGAKLSMGSNDWVFSTIVSTSLSATNTLVNSAATISGGTIFDGLIGGALSAAVSKTLSNMSLKFNTVDLTNITLGSGITLDGGVYSNTPLVVSEKIFENNPTFNLADGQEYTFDNDVGGFTLNLDSGTAIVNITGSTVNPPTLTGLGVITIPVVTTSTTFEIGADKASGSYVLRNTTDGIEISNGQHVFGTETIVADLTNVTSGVKDYELLYKPTSVITGTIAEQKFGQVSRITGRDDNSGDTSVTIVELYHPESLTGLAETIDSSSITTAFVITSDPAKALITVSGTSTNRAGTVPTQRSTLIALDTLIDDRNQYLTFLSTNGIIEDIVSPAQGNIIEFDNENELILFATAETLVVQQITGVIGLSETDNVAVFISSTDGTLSTPGVIIYDAKLVSNAQLEAAALVGSEEALGDVKNVLGWKVVEGDGELIGLAPNTAYVTGTDYTDNIKRT